MKKQMKTISGFIVTVYKGGVIVAMQAFAEKDKYEAHRWGGVTNFPPNEFAVYIKSGMIQAAR